MEPDLVGGQWRIHSFRFNVMRDDGYPITFREDGTHESRHWKISHFWRRSDENEVVLLDRYQHETVRFSFRADLGVFVAYRGDPKGYPYAMLGPEGTDFGKVLSALTAPGT